MSRAGRACRAAGVLRVRRACPRDLGPLQFFLDTALRRDYFVRRGQLRDWLGGARHTLLVAEIDGLLVGLAVLTHGARLVNALVHPAYRGLGIGRRLIRASGARSVRAKLDMSSGDPRPFYERLGFRATGRFNARGTVELLTRPGAGASGEC